MGAVNLTIEGTQEIDNSLKALSGMGARKRDVTKVFSVGMRPLVKAGKANAPIRKRDAKSKLYDSRNHPPGTLRRSIKFKTSKRYKSVWYVFPDRGGSKRFDAWYAHFVGLGTKRGIIANPFMDRAWAATQGAVIGGIESGLKSLMDKLWTNGR